MPPWLPVAVRVTVEILPELDDLVKVYFRIGFSNNEILSPLAHNNHIVLSIRTWFLLLFRRNHTSPCGYIQYIGREWVVCVCMQVCVCVNTKRYRQGNTILPNSHGALSDREETEVHASVPVMVPFKFAIKLSSIPCVCQHRAYYTLENNSLASSLYVETKG